MKLAIQCVHIMAYSGSPHTHAQKHSSHFWQHMAAYGGVKAPRSGVLTSLKQPCIMLVKDCDIH